MSITEIRERKGMGAINAIYGSKATEKTIASLQPKAKKPIAKQSAKKKAKADEEKQLQAEDKAFYGLIWSSSAHICQCGCKAKLGNEPLTTMFHHVLFKAQYPAFRHTPENVMLLHPDCHNAYHANPDSRPKIKARQIELLKLLIA